MGINDLIAVGFVCIWIIVCLTALLMGVLAWFSRLEDWQLCRLWFGLAGFCSLILVVMEAMGVSID